MEKGKTSILSYDKKWMELQLIEILFAKHFITETHWIQVKKGYVAYFTNNI